eukprot:gb/GECG01010963.1/.p1 GENE.gb/GECG01010963.1/~~gb/GECG01010963.1/.p1  ORF type:complete len:291 (+),score=32.42 gb/GECG01010963.1/:1-873(+)
MGGCASSQALDAGSAGVGGGLIRIFVKTLTGKTITLAMRPYDMVMQIKQNIEQQEGIGVTTQRLIFGGKILDQDELTINELGLKNDTTLHLVISHKSRQPATQPPQQPPAQPAAGGTSVYSTQQSAYSAQPNPMCQFQGGNPYDANPPPLYTVGSSYSPESSAWGGEAPPAPYMMSSYMVEQQVPPYPAPDTTHNGQEPVTSTLPNKDIPAYNEGQNFRLYVKSLTGKTVCLEERRSAMILQIKEGIKAQLGIAPEKQRLIYAGKQLEDEFQTIEEAGILPDATVHLLVK